MDKIAKVFALLLDLLTLRSKFDHLESMIKEVEERQDNLHEELHSLREQLSCLSHY